MENPRRHRHTCLHKPHKITACFRSARGVAFSASHLHVCTAMTIADTRVQNNVIGTVTLHNNAVVMESA